MTSSDRHMPTPPPALAARMGEALDAVQGRSVSPANAAFDAAMRLVDGILRDDTGSRTGAISLLAADALVTQAFELAAADPQCIEPLAMHAMVRIADAAGRAR
jgi:hypothetical protein